MDESVGDLGYPLGQFYQQSTLFASELPRGLDGALRAIFEDLGTWEETSTAPRLPAAALLGRLEQEIAANVYRGSLRRTALTHSIPYYTTVAGARAAVQAIGALRQGCLEVAPLQTYLSSPVSLSR